MKSVKRLLWLGALIIIAAAALAVYRTLVEQVGDLFPQHKTDTRSDGPEGAPLAFKTGVLELSVLKSPQETFSRSDALAWKGFALASNVSEIRVDATFRYHVPIDPKGWHVKRVGDVFRVIVPAVQPSLPVAVDMSSLRKRTDPTWLYFNPGADLQVLEKTITDALAKRATIPSYIEQQRPKAREAAAEFVRRWLITQERWKDIGPDQVRVFFADEPIERMDAWQTNF